MAVIFKITNGDTSLEFPYPNDDGYIDVWARVEPNPSSSISVIIDKHDAIELRDFLNRMIPEME